MEKQKGVVAEALSTALEMNDDSRKALQENLHAACNDLREWISEMEERINSELEKEFCSEDNRLQKAYSELNSCDSTNKEVLSNLIQKARAELLVRKYYSLERLSLKDITDFSRLYRLETRTEFSLEWVNKATIDLKVPKVEARVVLFQFDFLNPDEERVLGDAVKYTVRLKKKDGQGSVIESGLNRSSEHKFSFSLDTLEPGATYLAQVRATIQGQEGGRSNVVEFTVPWSTERCSWKQCLNYNSYSLGPKNPRIATKNFYDNDRCVTIIGNTPLPLNKVTSWSIKILKSRGNNGNGISLALLRLA